MRPRPSVYVNVVIFEELPSKLRSLRVVYGVSVLEAKMTLCPGPVWQPILDRTFNLNLYW